MSQDPSTSLRTPWTTSAPGETASLQRQLSEQRLASEQLRLLGSAIHVTGQGIAILTPAVEAEGPRVAFVNDGFCAMFGRTRAEIIGETPDAFGIVEAHRAIHDALLRNVFEQKPFDAEMTARRKNGTAFQLVLPLAPVAEAGERPARGKGGAEVHLALQLVPVSDAGQLTHWVAFLRDVTESKNELLMLRHQAMHDGLTDLPNRTLLFERLERALEEARGESVMVALLLMDLDRFKEVNDTFGHHFGDVLLKQVAFRIRNQLSAEDTVARLGGDAFAIVLPRAADANAVAATARRILNALEQAFVVEGQVLEVGASIGIALHPRHGSDARALMRCADVAMYSAKQGNSGYSFHSIERETRSPDQLALVVEMRSAVEQRQFELYYQPKVPRRSRLMTRAEVLVRGRHQRRGLLVPAQFNPLAERTGIIRSLTDWILDAALKQCRDWQDAGAPLHLAVNISAKSLQDQALPAKVQAALDRWHIDPRFLKIEITESSIMADPAHALAILSMLPSMGGRVAIG